MSDRLRHLTLDRKDSERENMNRDTRMVIRTIVLSLTLGVVLASMAGAQEVLPKPEPPFKGKIGRTAKESTPDFPRGITAPKGAPNVLIVILDDVGFGHAGTFGGAVSEVVFVVRSQRGLEQFYGSQFKIGMNIGVAAGPMGGGMGLEGLTADLFVYARAKGAFVGTAVKGGHIAVADKANQAYYGKPVKPTDILVERTVSNPQAQELRTAMAEAMR
jgi:hypothetical protein